MVTWRQITDVETGDSWYLVFDASVHIHLPRGRGTIELGILNLFDESCRFRDMGP